ncbi:hypothetical protein HF086_018157 [Spodoptera exigua]|uniref:Decaprenyl-diphosphate synthase subunit 1 n=1 Tax=Spodoptera exigua TaxID=7107 RepID=A0A922MQ67_SPOEX|nr:hypothetical protein HF086_018157 [Spodoptera exigua]
MSFNYRESQHAALLAGRAVSARPLRAGWCAAWRPVSRAQALAPYQTTAHRSSILTVYWKTTSMEYMKTSDPPFVRQELERNTNQSELNTIATYYFDGQGKALRPMVAILMARAVNYHVYGENRLLLINLINVFILWSSALLPSQRQVAMISEMIHSASLIHDDVIDQSDFRRGKPSVNVLWNHKKVKIFFN